MVTVALKEYLEKHVNIQEVHFNSAGEYIFMHRPTHLLAMTREQVLNAPIDKVEEVVTNIVSSEIQTVKNGVTEAEVEIIVNKKKTK